MVLVAPPWLAIVTVASGRRVIGWRLGTTWAPQVAVSSTRGRTNVILIVRRDPAVAMWRRWGSDTGGVRTCHIEKPSWSASGPTFAVSESVQVAYLVVPALPSDRIEGQSVLCWSARYLPRLMRKPLMALAPAIRVWTGMVMSNRKQAGRARTLVTHIHDQTASLLAG